MAKHLRKFDFSDFEPAFDDDASETLEAKERPQSSNQARAHELLEYWFKKTTIIHWPTLKEHEQEINKSLHHRISNPNLIDQGPTGLCGPASFMRSLAWDDPCEFALFAGLLYQGGWANLGRHGRVLKKIKPSALTRMSKIPPGMDPADWLILASLRDAYNNVFHYRWDELNQAIGMTVGTMADFFKGAGYSQVIEDLGGSAIFKGGVSKGIENIDKANMYFRRGFAVSLLIDAEILDTDQPGLSVVANHWIGLRSMIEVNQFWKHWSQNPTSRIGVQIQDVWSWGLTKRIPPYPDGHPTSGDYYMPFENFCKCYYGFVAAKA